MKKFIIVLLLILPIFLMVSISIAGRIFSYLTYINVEKVSIVDTLEQDVEKIKINKDETYTLLVKVYPELANNKRLKFISLDTNVATVDENGVITGINYGFTTVIVQSVDSDVTDKITVNVSNENVESIDISLSSLEIYLYQSSILSAFIYPKSAAENKIIEWSSSNPSYVSVDANGKLTAHKITETGQPIIITATVDGISDYCEVTVLTHLFAFKPQITDNTNTYISNETTINLMDLIVYDNTKINADDITFKLLGGKKYATLSENELSFNTNEQGFEGQYIKLLVYIDNENSQNEGIEFYVRYLSNA